jgi:hypothetical protein
VPDTQRFATPGGGPDDDRTMRDLGGPGADFPAPPPADSPVARPTAKTWLIVAAVVVVVVIAGAAVLLTRHSAGGSTPVKTSSPSARSTPATPKPKPTPTSVVPPGYQRSGGPDGSSLAVPAGWTRQVVGANSVRWTQPRTGAYIQSDGIPWEVPDPVEHWRRFEHQVVSKNVLPGFRETRLSDRFAPRGWPASDLEYTWSTRDHGTMRAYDRGFTANGHQYAIMVAAPLGQWPHYASVIDDVFGSFRPAP